MKHLFKALLFFVLLVATLCIVFTKSNNLPALSASYYAQNVKATITGTYYKTGVKIQDLKTTEGSNVIEFDGNEKSSASKDFVAVDDITLKSRDYIVFEYIITNTDEENGTNFDVVVQKNGEMQNLTLEYLVSDSQIEINKDTENMQDVEFEFTTLTALNTQETAYIYFRIAIDNVEKDASFGGGLTFVMTAID